MIPKSKNLEDLLEDQLLVATSLWLIATQLFHWSHRGRKLQPWAHLYADSEMLIRCWLIFLCWCLALESMAPISKSDTMSCILGSFEWASQATLCIRYTPLLPRIIKNRTIYYYVSDYQLTIKCQRRVRHTLKTAFLRTCVTTWPTVNNCWEADHVFVRKQSVSHPAAAPPSPLLNSLFSVSLRSATCRQCRELANMPAVSSASLTVNCERQSRPCVKCKEELLLNELRWWVKMTSACARAAWLSVAC